MTKLSKSKNVGYNLGCISYYSIGILAPNNGNTNSRKYFVNTDKYLWQVLSKPWSTVVLSGPCGLLCVILCKLINGNLTWYFKR